MKLMTKSLLAASLVVGTAMPTQAATNDQEFKAFAKILSLSKDVTPGDVSIGVVYDGSNATSQADLDAIKGIVGAAFKGAKHNISVEGISVADLAAKGASKKVLVSTEGLSADAQGQIHSLAKSNQALTVSTDISSVEGGKIVLGIDVEGGAVKIIMNGNAYRDIGLNFDAAFEFMVQEI